MALTNNDVLRRLRYALDYNDTTMISTFGLADCVVTRKEVIAWLKNETDPDQVPCSDLQLATFLNGLIIKLRGKKDGPQPQPESVLTHNIILRKLKIALNLQAEDMLEILKLSGLVLSKHELSAFFRKPGNTHYQPCKDQALRNFLNGVRLKYRASRKARPEKA